MEDGGRRGQFFSSNINALNGGRGLVRYLADEAGGDTSSATNGDNTV